MRTKQMDAPDAILTADWHLRETQPICRTDNFWDAQWGKVKFIRELQEKYDCPVLHSGDLFDYWKPSPYLLSTTIRNLPKKFKTVLGNHDLPQHNIDLVNKSGVMTLFESNSLDILSGVHWKQDVQSKHAIQYKERKILVWHTMTFIHEPFPGCQDAPAQRLLELFPEYDLIVTGDNHKSFTVQHNGRLLVNPGAITRQKADETESSPRIYLWYASNNSVQPVYLPIVEQVINRQHIVQQNERNERIGAFIQMLNTEYTATVSFESNLEQFKQVNNIRQSVMDIIYKAIDV